MVEFGIIALLFTLLMFAVVDLGLLLNTWLRLSAAAREVGRDASVGYTRTNLKTVVNGLTLPGVNRANNDIFTNYCCGDGGSNDKVVLTIKYKSCPTGMASCVDVTSQTSNQFWAGTCIGLVAPAGPCLHPVRGDVITVSISAPGMEVITPLVRPFFGCNDNNKLHCYVSLGSTATLRYE